MWSIRHQCWRVCSPTSNIKVGSPSQAHNGWRSSFTTVVRPSCFELAKILFSDYGYGQSADQYLTCNWTEWLIGTWFYRFALFTLLQVQILHAITGLLNDDFIHNLMKANEHCAESLLALHTNGSWANSVNEHATWESMWLEHLHITAYTKLRTCYFLNLVLLFLKLCRCRLYIIKCP